MIVQQTLVIETQDPSIRAPALGWTAEDPRGANPTRAVGICGAYWDHPANCNLSYTYPDVLRAQADGWRLLAPPRATSDGWEWWLVRDVETRYA